MKTIIVTILIAMLSWTVNAQNNPRAMQRIASISAITDQTVLLDTLNKLEKSNNETDLSLLLAYYVKTKQGGKYDSLMKSILQRFPNGSIAFDEMTSKIYNERDPVQNEKNYAELTRRFGSRPGFDLDFSSYYVAINYLGKGRPDKVKFFLDKIKNQEYKSRAFSYAARESIGKKDYVLGEELIRKTFEYLKGDTTHRDMYDFRKIFSELLYENGKYQEGLPYAKMVYDKQPNKGSLASQQVVNTYLKYLIQLKKYKEAYPDMEIQIKAGTASDLIKERFREAYIAVNGPDKNYDTFVAGLQKELNEKILNRVASKMVNQPAFNFEVKDLSGKSVHLTDYKGKIVILDFWATWCGPCKASFPLMQMAVNKYKDDKNVVFLFIHTFETGSNPAKAAADYIKDMKYTFNVLIDGKDATTKKNPAAAGFNIDAIPTKIIIDGRGNIRFRTLGGGAGGSDAFLQEMEAMINIAKS